LIDAMTAARPGARPPAAYVSKELARIARLEEDGEELVASRRARIARAYLAARRRDLVAGARVSDAVAGPAREWLERALARVGTSERAPRAELGPIAELDRQRWLTTIIGPAGAAFVTEDVGEDVLASRMLALASTIAPEAFTEDDLRGKSRARASAAATPIDLAVALSAPGRIPEEVFARAEALAFDGDAPPSLVLALGTRLVASAEHARACIALSTSNERAATAMRAEALRRAGDRDAAAALAESVVANGAGDDDASRRARFVLARVAWEKGAYDRALSFEPALSLLDSVEIRALVKYARGDIDAGREIVARALAREGANARLYGLSGMLEHARGDAERALRDFGHAVELAVAAGALSDEATYRTGEAAAALDAGDVGRALAAANRALLVCERLGKRGLAARAWLTRAAAFAVCGAAFEATQAAAETRDRAAAASDDRCALYADLVRADASAHDDPDRASLVTTAIAHARTLGDDDTLRAIARSRDAAILGGADALRIEPRASVTARLEYWTARALAEPMHDAPFVLAAFHALANVRAPAAARAHAWDAARALATRVGDAEAARKFEHLLSEVRERIASSVPAAYRGRLLGLSWAKARGDADAASLPSAKLGELFAITRALGARDSLWELCEMTLDAMVLWSGVERGILLLPAPDGTLKVRAARNIRREDLRAGETQRLSMSMAERAFATKETVVADDAWATMADAHASIHALGLRSVLCVPLVSRGEVAGVVYLDDRQRRGAFGRDELAWVELVAGLAAMAIRDARDQALLRRAQRRAERATTKVTALLAERDSELSVANERLAQAEGVRVPGIVGESEAIKRVFSLIQRVAKSDVPVLILGESGTGKELVARAVAESGPRKGRPFLSENCASLPETLLESTLFGHVKGAFTGAVSQRVGLFDVADGGTLFLDEIGEMPPSMQVKLLRVLQDGEVRPVGGNKAHKVDVRILCATHRDLEKMVAAGNFREDLYYRLNVVSVRVPPLRERAEDIPVLLAHFIEKYASDKRIGVAPAAARRLLAYGWPGNVRQLENEVRRAVVLADRTIDEAVLSEEIVRSKATATGGGTLRARIDELETEAVRDALRRTRGNQTRAAALLGLSRFGLQKMMRRLAIDAGRD
jgi:transcriptional regulator with GAF, ATPase, and Fis domain